jgi:2-polyprenyl-6-methoxyphenol hydroxylase-like FAD-dependent oxidoreductase
MTPMIDALVVGAGPAGSHVAIQLARAGRDVVLVEREKQPVDKVCGEFLSHEAVHYLAACGVDLDALGAVPITAVRFIERSVQAEIALPFEARSLSRRLLDEAMLARATEEGVQVLRGRRVNALGPTTSGFTARLADATHLESQAAFLATGKHDLRGHARTGGLQNDLVAFKMHYVLAKAQTCAIERHVELVLFDGGYAGCSPSSTGTPTSVWWSDAAASRASATASRGSSPPCSPSHRTSAGASSTRRRAGRSHWRSRRFPTDTSSGTRMVCSSSATKRP